MFPITFEQFLINKNDPDKLKILYELGKLEKRPMEHVWFILYKNIFPGGIIAAFENHHFSRHHIPRGGVDHIMYSVIDFTLNVNFVNSTKFDASDFYEIKTFFINDNALLNPSQKDYGMWTVFHLKMRYMAFQLLRLLVERIGSTHPDIVRHYGKTLTTKTSEGELYKNIESFFRLDDIVDWSVQIRRVYDITEKAIPYKNSVQFLRLFHTPIDDDAFQVDLEKYSFVYDGSQEKIEQFRNYVLLK